jgi:hypothetical protein
MIEMQKITKEQFEQIQYRTRMPVIEKIIRKKRKFSRLLYDQHMELIATQTITHAGSVYKLL